MATLNSTKTLQSLADFTDVYDINNVAYLEQVGHIIAKSSTSFQKFYPYVKEYIAEYKVTKEQREKYQCKPDLLSTDVYGTPLLGWFIMWMNGQECPSKFKIKQTIMLIPPENIEDLFIVIKTKNQSKLDENWREIES